MSEPIEMRGDRVVVEPYAFHMPPSPGVPADCRLGTWPNSMRKLDIKNKMAGNPDGARFNILGRMQERLRIEEEEHTRLYGPPVNLGVDKRGTPPTKAERYDVRWQIEPHWSGLPQRIVGVVGLPRPGKPQMVPYGLDHKGPREFYWPTDTKETLMWQASERWVGWRMAPDKNDRQGCMGPGPLPKNPHVGFWWDETMQRLGEVYDPKEEGRLFL